MTNAFPLSLRRRDGSLTAEAMLALPLLLLALFLCVGLVYSVQGVMVLDRVLAEACQDLAENCYLLQQAWGMGLGFIQENEQIAGLLDQIPAKELGARLGESMVALYCVNRYLKDYPEIEAGLEWKLILMPGYAEGDANTPWGSLGGNGPLAALAGSEAGGENGGAGSESGAAGDGGFADAAAFAMHGFGALLEGSSLAFLSGQDGLFISEDDVLLVLTFSPAKMNRFTSLLPDSWKITIVKRQKAWLVGRSLLPQRGLEQQAGQKETGPLVYITRWGVKYHVEDCRYLAKSKIPAYLQQLSEVYGACSICTPPPRL